jgi:hypothetical protein
MQLNQKIFFIVLLRIQMATVGKAFLAGCNSVVYDLQLDSFHTVKILPQNSVSSAYLPESCKCSTGGSVWHAGIALSQHLMKNRSIVEGKAVLELGSGCGLTGIVCAALGATKVVLTDLMEQLPCIQTNIDLNASIWQSNSNRSCIVCRCLPFGDSCASVVSELNCSNELVIIASDIGFDLSLHNLILQTIKNIRMEFKKHNISILIAEEIRWSDIFQWFVDCLVEEFGHQIEVTRLSPGQLMNSHEHYTQSTSPIALIQGKIQSHHI